MIEIILMAVLLVALVIGAVSGLVKGYSKTSFWGVTVFATLALERIIGKAIGKNNPNLTIVTLVVSIVILIIFSLVFDILRKIINRKVTARRTLSEYENHDKIEETNSYIRNAVDQKNKADYKKYRKELKKVKIKSGPWGIVNKVLGAVSGVFNWLAATILCLAFVIIFVDLSQIPGILGLFSNFISSTIWSEMFGTFVLDLMTISLISLAIRSGYKSGISSVLTTVIVLGLIILFAIASYSVASSEAMAGAVSGLESGLLSAVPAMMSNLKHTLAVVITATVLFLISLVVIIIVAVFLPKFVDKFKENKIFKTVDGVFGAIVCTLIIIMMLYLFGGLAYSLTDLPAMERVNWYMGHSYLADCFYSCNPMNGMFGGLRALFGEVN